MDLLTSCCSAVLQRVSVSSFLLGFCVSSRITAAVEKVELLWQQAFSKAHLQLQVVQLRSDALEVSLGGSEQMFMKSLTDGN